MAEFVMKPANPARPGLAGQTTAAQLQLYQKYIDLDRDLGALAENHYHSAGTADFPETRAVVGRADDGSLRITIKSDNRTYLITLSTDGARGSEERLDSEKRCGKGHPDFQCPHISITRRPLSVTEAAGLLKPVTGHTLLRTSGRQIQELLDMLRNEGPVSLDGLTGTWTLKKGNTGGVVLDKNGTDRLHLAFDARGRLIESSTASTDILELLKTGGKAYEPSRAVSPSEAARHLEIFRDDCAASE